MRRANSEEINGIINPANAIKPKGIKRRHYRAKNELSSYFYGIGVAQGILKDTSDIASYRTPPSPLRFRQLDKRL